MSDEKSRSIASMLNARGPANLIGTDINNVIVRAVDTHFPQGDAGSPTGLRVEFEISFDAIGRMGDASKHLHEAAKLCGVPLKYTD